MVSDSRFQASTPGWVRWVRLMSRFVTKCHGLVDIAIAENATNHAYTELVSNINSKSVQNVSLPTNSRKEAHLGATRGRQFLSGRGHGQFFLGEALRHNDTQQDFL